MNYETPRVLAGTDWVRRNYEGDRCSKILIINGDSGSAYVSVDFLRGFAFEVAETHTLEDGICNIADERPDLVLLSVQRNQVEGLQMIVKIRTQFDVPIIVVTRNRDDRINCTPYLEIGADDCLAEPTGQRELVSRIRAVLRRAPKVCATQKKIEDPRRYRFGDWTLNRRLRTLTNGTGSQIHLTKGDFALLVAFVDAPQRPLSREYLLHVTRMHEDIIDRAIDVKVLRLRKKLEKDPTKPWVIQTERGVGYVFTLPVERLEC